MQTLLIIIVCLAVIFIIGITAIQILLRNKANELLEKLNSITTYSVTAGGKGNKQSKTNLSIPNDAIFVDIPTDINNSFNDKIISATQGLDFINHYRPYFQEAYSLAKKLELFNISISDPISTIISDFEQIDSIIKQHNETVISDILQTHKVFFDHCLKYPLDSQQRRSIVSEEDNCLVVSSAGSGKTSSIVGKVKYLTEIKGIDPKKILLISYTNKAASELSERIATDGLNGYTFHKLAIDIIGKETGIKPSICDNADALFV